MIFCVLSAGLKTKNPGFGHGVFGFIGSEVSPISTAPRSAEEHEEEAIETYFYRRNHFTAC